MILRWAIFSFVLLLAPAAAAAPLYPLTPNKLQDISMQDFVEMLPKAIKKSLKENLNGKDFVVPDFSQIEVGESVFFPFQVVGLGQPEVSFYYVLDKINDALVEGNVKWKRKTQRFHLLHNEGRSLFGEANCGSGIVIGEKIYLNDGNTKALASLLMGSTEYCVTIKAKFPEASLNDPEFRRQMAREGYLFLWNDDGSEVESLPAWEEVRDHPGRTFMVQHRIKVKAHFDYES